MSSRYGLLFARTKSGDPVRRICDTGNLNKVYNILEDFCGVGCHIEKTDSGLGWMMIVDGTGASDTEPPPGYTPPDETAVKAVADALRESGDPDLAAIADALDYAVDDAASARNPPPCGNPLNEDGGGFFPPLENNDDNPLNYEGDGGYTPKCNKTA